MSSEGAEELCRANTSEKEFMFFNQCNYSSHTPTNRPSLSQRRTVSEPLITGSSSAILIWRASSGRNNAASSAMTPFTSSTAPLATVLASTHSLALSPETFQCPRAWSWFFTALETSLSCSRICKQMERRFEKRKHSPGQSDKKKRKVITLEQKIDVIRRPADGHSNSKISSDISLHEATIRKILKQETVLKETSRAVSSFSSLGAAARKRSIAMIEMESLLSIWIEDCN
ncbi:hypothetical protein M513_12500 [Trichuris suis]|uniref:HTH psq-type domain-containing protein n=1 Tax=Trichuris suis TaxID=68888 RepID=A0A085LNU9_9BILA|nr:hypothetical protein M513_12500 [Trichuris suis]